MTRERVAGYRSLCRTVELLDRRLAAAGREPGGETALDTLRVQRDRLEAERQEIRRFVDLVREVDEVAWQIIEMYYMSREKPTLQAVAMRMGWQSEFAPRHRLKVFFERVERLEEAG